ncbi:hypothetical protein M408DRAFT_24459 [Serendipita vermifera MAFF 305830]|uniref:DNA binding protein Ncp1 n=1 Tax=Serendipita vermifera MAFF 305830 TaxID=933852 RepID=A0A0C2XEI2_SERVB|nr:hypothetical protein M408DRAFT_24459 [Serendipita vermifera MAFF 305830]
MSTTLQYVNGAPLSPAATEYHDPLNANEDQPQVTVHEPTPVYEKNPAFPNPQPYRQPVDRSQATSPAPGSTNSKRVSIVDENVVLGQGERVGVNRSGTWARGAGTSGINEDGYTGNHSRKPSLADRARDATQHISVERQATLSKAEKKDAKRLSKIIMSEGKAEDKALKAALKELASLQAAQKKASAAETAATHAQSKAAREQQRATAAYLEAKTRHERAVSNLAVCQERLTLTKEHAQKTTAMVRHQAEEVDAMRERKATDDREREVKLANLKAGLLSP